MRSGGWRIIGISLSRASSGVDVNKWGNAGDLVRGVDLQRIPLPVLSQFFCG